MAVFCVFWKKLNRLCLHDFLRILPRGLTSQPYVYVDVNEDASIIPVADPIHSPALNSPIRGNTKAPAFSELIPPPSPPPTYKTPMKIEENESGVKLQKSKSYGGRSSSFKDRFTSMFSRGRNAGGGGEDLEYQ